MISITIAIRTFVCFCLLSLSVLATAIAGSGIEKEYWAFIAMNPGDRPLITGTLRLDWSEDKSVIGDFHLDYTPNAVYKLSVKARNDMEGEVSGELKASNSDDEEKSHDVSCGSFTLKKAITDNQITWGGIVRLSNPRTFWKCIDPAKLNSIPESLYFELITFRKGNDEFGGQRLVPGDGGRTPGLIFAKPKLGKSSEALTWLESKHFDVDPISSGNLSIHVPGFEEPKVVWDILKSGLFDNATMELLDAGPDGGYYLHFRTTTIFPGNTFDQSKTEMFTKKLVEALKMNSAFKGVILSDLIPHRQYSYRMSVLGRSEVLSGERSGYWEKYIIEYSFYRDLNQADSELTLLISLVDIRGAKGPASTIPPPERFDAVEDGHTVLEKIGVLSATTSNPIAHGTTY